MFTYEKAQNNGTFVEMIVAALVSALGASEKKLDFVVLHPLLAAIRFIRSLGNAENKAKREALTLKMQADGKTIAEIDKAVKAQTRDRDINILRRMSACSRGNADFIILTIPMQNKIISLLKQSVGFKGNVTTEMLNDALCHVTEILVEKATTVNYAELSTAPTLPADVELSKKEKAKKEAQAA